MLLVPVVPGLYPTAAARLLRALALAGQARDADADQRGGLLAELDEVTRWLAARAADAPGQLPAPAAAGGGRAGVGGRGLPRRRPGLRRRPARGRPAAAALAPGPDRRARRPLLPRPRPGHAGHDLLAQARQEYLIWGATAEFAQLDWAYPVRRPPSGPAATAGEPSATFPSAVPPSRPERSTCSGFSGVAGAELGDQHRRAARPRGCRCSAR